MIKPRSLQAYLLQCVPQLAQNPDQMQVFVDQGSLQANLKRSLSFEYEYSLQLIFTDLALHPDQVLVPILAWLRTNQPDAADDAVRFQAEVIRKDLIDLSVTLPLTERVLVSEEDGTFTIKHIDEPVFEYSLPDPALFKALFADDLRDSLDHQLMTEGYIEKEPI
ncbi:MAG: phage tail protein [Marinobacterium sp.]|nr:phage tail protein [Marinobacterium sp.]